MRNQDKQIAKRKVSRWYYDGKGYASLTSALRAKGKAILREEIYGVHREKLYARANQLEDEGEADGYGVALGQLYAERFPHSPDKSCTRPIGGCTRIDRIAWCKLARDKWLSEFIQEQLKEETQKL